MAQKVLTIADGGNTVKFIRDDGVEYNLNKADHDVIGNPAKSEYIIQRDKDNVLIFRFADVTTPLLGDFATLLAFIQDLLDVTVLAAGAATEATLATRLAEATFVAEDFAQEVTQALIKAKTDNLDVALSTVATEVTLALIKAKTDNLDVLLSTIGTEATLALIKAKTDNLDVVLSTVATEVTLALIKAKTDNLDVALSTLLSLPTTIAEGRKIVGAPGAAVKIITASTPCKQVILTGEEDNTGTVVFGGAGVIAAIGTRKGTPLLAAGSGVIDIDNANKVFIDAVVATEGVTFTILT